MKKLSFAFIILLIAHVSCLAQEDCSGKYIRLIKKNELVAASCDKMFLLNAETFGRFYYAALKMDSLIILLPAQKIILDSLNKLSLEQQNILNEEINLRNTQLVDKSHAIERLENLVKISTENNDDCINKYANLVDRNGKEIKRKKMWRAATGIVSGISLTLLLALML